VIEAGALGILDLLEAVLHAAAMAINTNDFLNIRTPAKAFRFIQRR
jgi:hypothetical protein